MYMSVANAEADAAIIVAAKIDNASLFVFITRIHVL